MRPSPAGFPGIRFTEAVEDFAHQHQDPRVQDGTQYGDLLKYVDFDYTARVARVNLASMWSAANAPAMPRNVTISENIGFPAVNDSTPLEAISNDSLLKWTTGNDPWQPRMKLCGDLASLCSGRTLWRWGTRARRL